MVGFSRDKRVAQRSDEAEDIHWRNNQQCNVIAVAQGFRNSLWLLAMFHPGVQGVERSS